jgi:hypothetical protein
VIRKCPRCGAELGPWESPGGCLKHQSVPGRAIAERALRLLEEADQALPYWDIGRLLRASGRDVYEPSLKAQLATDRRFCWAGRGIYGLFRHGFVPGVRDLARVGGIYLHAAGRPLTVAELDFILKFVRYRYQELSLRNALWRGTGLGIYRSESAESWSAARDSKSGQREVARAMGMRRGPIFREIVERTTVQVEAALCERERRLIDPFVSLVAADPNRHQVRYAR